ncbi:MAG: asparagine synthase (glutamine-hydrolyzing) [Hyphomicrobiaceae bacterium]|nr:MAG: asparagine synthase (glutamine-hydrolyzing) [Hyphomicrobiaceae bacterium]
MCGIAGFFDPAGRRPAEWLERLAGAMEKSLTHRGPDEGNIWCDADAGLAFAHRRLSIVDLSPAGRQPMVSASGRSVICYNGEIYNAEEVRAALGQKAPNWRGHSDTEAILELFDAKGVEASMPKLNGMFAFALYQRDNRRLWLARDRLGEKPLYWAMHEGALLFASELRALRQVPGFDPDLDRNAVASYLRHGYYPHPHTVYQGVRQLPPGHILSFAAGSDPQVKAYWSLADAVRQGRANPFLGSEAEAIDALEALLGDAVKRRMVADVPLGAFLSGGYDSSAVVALMQKSSARPVRTFSIGFDNQIFNEAPHARAVAAHLGTDHTELYVTARDAQALIPNLADMFDEPFADSSQIPTHLVSRLARPHVTVALSGDGGDELFAGYNRYAQGALFQSSAGRIPRAVRNVGASALRAMSPESWDRLFALAPRRLRIPLAGDKMHKLADVAAVDGDEFYFRLVSAWLQPGDIVPAAREPMTLVSDPSVKDVVPDFVERMQYRDTLTYLPDDILTKVDRASMAVALEARVPILDHRVVEFAWRLPMAMKLKAGERKWILRQMLYRHVPKALLDRPKMGFGVPVGEWLRGPLKDWAESLLSERALKASGLVEPGPVRARWEEHLSGRRNWFSSLWTVLMLEAWHSRWKCPSRADVAA